MTVDLQFGGLLDFWSNLSQKLVKNEKLGFYYLFFSCYLEHTYFVFGLSYENN